MIFFTPHDPPFRWAAIGDSYTAGPGAGEPDPGDSDGCVRSVGSYATQLQGDWPYNGDSNDHPLDVIACTGDKTSDVIKTQLLKLPSDPAKDLVVLTLGGNDIGFSKIAKACIIGLIGAGDCDDKIIE